MRFLFTILLIILTHALAAQNIDWLNGAGSDLYDYVDNVEVDKAGNSYLVGQIYDTATFDTATLNFPGNGFKNGKTYFAKYDSSGNIKWVDTANKTSTTQFTIDDYGNFYVSGGVRTGGIKFPNGKSVNNGRYLINLKQSTGKVEWIDSIPGGFGCEEITTDQNGNIYLAGSISNQYVINKDTFKNNQFNTALLLKFDSTGIYQWGRQNNYVSASSSGQAIATDGNGNSYFGGDFFDSIQFGSLNKPNVTNLDNFLVKHNPAGNPQWLKVFSGDGQQRIEGLTVNAQDELYTVGYFSDSVKVGNFKTKGFSVRTQLLFYSKISLNSNVQWLKKSGSFNGGNVNPSLVITSNNNFTYFGGSLKAGGLGTSKYLFGGDTIEVSNISFFTSKINPNGNFLWTFSSSISSFSSLEGIGVDNSGNAYATGQFQDSLSFKNKTVFSKGK
ncbi:MAG: hypothetical protein BRD49_04440, partial [Bacteroidetes bacterium SW_10_40_5]